MGKTRVEALYDFYLTSKESMGLPELLFVSAVSKAKIICGEWVRSIDSQETPDSITVDWREDGLIQLYNTVDAILSDPRQNFLNSAPRIREAIQECRENLGPMLDLEERYFAEIESAVAAEFNVLRVQQGDKVIIRFSDGTSALQAAVVRDAIAEKIPDVVFIAVVGDMEFSIIQLETPNVGNSG